ncbi:sugar transferase [Pseudogemmobacter sonorensis]|uniref:sugar transferase n=1 Tax=Pseudogemmobacter sonorensis TaxID=2989681 RepID=UPI0036BD018F
MKGRYADNAGAALRGEDACLRFEAGTYRRFGKRGLDVALVLLSAPVTVPVILVLALLVSLSGGAPLFGHRRIGVNGQPFRCWKLRSMVIDSQERLARHLRENPQARAEWDATFKLTDDPRVTRFGAFLRATSLDELPQLWNVLKGEMSLVGPRPVTEVELLQYGEARRYYEAVRPGLTGRWQVSGRNDVSYADRIAMDKEYVSEIGLVADLRIIFQTFFAVIARTGR